MSLGERLAEVDARIADRLRSLGRTDPVTRIVITKNHPYELVRDLYALGVRDFGENRDQEAKPKAQQLAAEGLSQDVQWHFVGQLQSNKAKSVISYANVIHSLDRESLLDALIKATVDSPARTKVFVQVNLTDDLERGGVNPDELLSMADRIAATESLQLLGVMAVGGLGIDPRIEFERVARLRERLVRQHPDANFISAGMSGDFEVALEYGATHLRIGTAITGNRNH
ncbi:MAG: YggS family pyridoxal phosphate-dependent enzyme [Microbacteriaceae bacterium]